MKLYELVEKTYLEHGNMHCDLRVKTPEVSRKFGRGQTYNGKPVGFGGVSGVLTDIPAYLGGCEVLSFKIKDGCFSNLYLGGIKRMEVII